ncbi:MAG: methyl-accepting chemotaxis protein [Deltaproteobacteria bacterium]|nr:methyl-accepting chemotaxis protein [Deltaproteobacteria bacterium]
MGSQSIRTKIALWTGMCLLFTFGVNLSLSVISARQKALFYAQQTASVSAVENMLKIQTVLERAMFTARGFAQAVTATKDQSQQITLSRRQINLMLRRMVLENPDFVGGSTCWEPNAFDGRDAEYANTPGHDSTGRVNYYWVQDGSGNLSNENLTTFADEPWYRVPVRKGHETLSGPYMYTIRDKDVFMTTVSVPIKDKNQVYGVATIDLTLDFLQQLVDEANVFAGAGRMSIVSNAGVQIAASEMGEMDGNPWADQPSYNPLLLENISRGETYYDWNKQGMEICVPLHIGQNDRPWGIYIQVPAHTVLASVNAQMWKELSSGLISIAIALLLLWVIATKISKSIMMGTEMAERISRGDLSPRLKFDRIDEIGKLANAMNRMAESLTYKASQSEMIAADESQQRLALSSELDHFSQSLQTITVNFNNLLSQIDRDGRQILLSSDEIKEIGCTMALRSSEQVAQVEQISRTVSEIATQLQLEGLQNGESNEQLAQRLQQVRKVLDQIGWVAHHNAAHAGDCLKVNNELNDHALSLNLELQRVKFLEQMSAGTPSDCN